MKSELEQWALEWRERIGNLYHLNAQRLEVWQPNLSLTQQSAAFQDRHQALAEALESVHDEAKKLAAPISKSIVTATIKPVPKSANQLQRECANSLLDHWQGLKLFLDYPAVPMDNNAAENAIRGPVTGRKNYYGSGSLWSADLTATMFTIFQTFALWGIPVRDWLTGYLQACAENGGKPPIDVTPFLPWSRADKPPKGLPPSPFSVQNTIIDTS
jgi:transposase